MAAAVAASAISAGEQSKSNPGAPTQGRNWKANLKLGFEQRKNGTILVQRSHQGPLYVQKPFYPEGQSSCHTYILHPPAGIAGGDDLTVSVELGIDAHALLTTPAATKFYRANPYVGSLRQDLTLKQGATLEWLPQENIIFKGADALIDTRVHLQETARLIAWDSQCLGRPACDEDFAEGRCRQRFEIWKDQQPLFIDALDVRAETAMRHAPWGLAGQAVNALMLAYPANGELLSEVNQFLQQKRQAFFSATLVDGLLLMRFLSHDSELVQNSMRQLWQLLRPQILNRQACIPRIWNT